MHGSRDGDWVLLFFTSFVGVDLGFDQACGVADLCLAEMVGIDR